jgi:hypothetical protein
MKVRRSTKRKPSNRKGTGATTNAVHAPAAALPFPVDLPPDVGAPVTPAWDSRLRRGYYPNRRELATMPNVAKELARFSDYANVLGSPFLPARTVAASIDVALLWRHEREAAAAWFAYAQGQDVRAWAGTMKLLHEAGPALTNAMKKDPKLARAYPWLAALFAEAHVTAKKANATKAKKARAKSKAEADAATAAAVEAARVKGVAAATSAAADVARTKGKTITINT